MALLDDALADLRHTVAALERQLAERTAERDEALAQQSATAEILRAIARSPGDVRPVFETIVGSAARVCEAEFSGVARFEDGLLHLVAVHSMSPEESAAFHSLFPRAPVRNFVMGRAFADARPAHSADVLAEPDYDTRTRDVLQSVVRYRSFLGVPILHEGKPIGVIGCGRRAVKPFTATQIELLETFADQAAIAIENVRLVNELETRNRELGESLKQQTATAEVLQVVNSSPGDLEPVFQAIVEKAHTLCSAACGSLQLWDGERFRGIAMRGFSEAMAEGLRQGYIPGPNHPCRRLLEGERVAHCVDLAEIDDPVTHAGGVALGGIRTILFVALRKDDVLLGQIVAARQEVRPFTEKEIALVENFAAQAVIAMENARLLRELRTRTDDLQESLEYQTATSDVLKVISRSTFDLQPVLDTLSETAARLCQAEYGAILRRDGEVYRMAAAVSLAPDGVGTARDYMAFLQRHPLRPGRGSLTGRVALEGGTVQIADCAADSEYTLSEATALGGLRTQLGVPLFREGSLIGVMVLGRRRVETFTDKQIEVVTTFADQAVIAIENARLITETREALEQQTATAEVLQVINSSPGDLEPVFDAMLEKATRLCEASFGTLWTYDGENMHASAVRGAPPRYAEFLRNGPHEPSPIAHQPLLRGERIVHLADIAIHEGYRSGLALPHPVVELGGVRTLLAVPLRKDEELLGVFSIYRQEVRPFSEKQIALLENFAAQAVIAIENARLLTETREALEQQTATAEVLQVINSSPGDLAPVFAAILDKAHTLCGATLGSLFLFDGELFRAAATHGYPEDLAQHLRQGVILSATPQLLDDSIPWVHNPDLTQVDTPTARAVSGRGGVRTNLMLPLRKEGRLLGAISCNRQEVRPFTDKEIALLQNFATQAVIAIENARLLGEIRQRQQELRVTFDNMGDGVAMFDAELRLAAWNLNFQRILDLPDALLAERPAYADYIRILAERGEFGSGDIEAELSRRLEVTDQELRLERMRPDGRVIEVRRNAVPGGGFVLIYSDVTERKRSEEAIRAARDAAEAALRELKTAQASLIHAEKMASLGQLTAGIAHEIKNPLNFVNNFAGLSVELLDELKDAAAPAVASVGDETRAEIDEIVGMLIGNLEKIAAHGRRADGIVKSMLAHSRGGSGERQSVDINSLVEEALNLAYHGARAQDQNFNITLERDLDRSIAPIELVPQDVTRVFLNLFGNGFYAANKRCNSGGDPQFRPSLKVTTRDLGQAVEVRVRDNGVGIPPEFRDKLFQPFFTTKPTGEGTGLGLSISYDIVTQQHGGTIAVDSTPGKFTEFTIRLPRSRQATMAGQTE